MAAPEAVGAARRPARRVTGSAVVAYHIVAVAVTLAALFGPAAREAARLACCGRPPTGGRRPALRAVPHQSTRPGRGRCMSPRWSCLALPCKQERSVADGRLCGCACVLSLYHAEQRGWAGRFSVFRRHELRDAHMSPPPRSVRCRNRGCRSCIAPWRRCWRQWMRRVWRFHDFWGTRPAPAVLLVPQVYDLAAYVSAAGATGSRPPRRRC